MDEPNYLWQTGVGIVLAAFGWLGKRAVERVDELESRLDGLERTSITKGELKETLDEHSKTIIGAINRVADDVEKGHRDVITRIGAVDLKAERANQRLDALKDEELARLRAQHG